MQFWRMDDVGNDLIILNNLQEGLSADYLPILARRLCERRLLIGVDGLMAVERPQSGGDYRMLFCSSGGSIDEIYGSGARCICCCGYGIELAGEPQRVKTTASLVTDRCITQRQYRIELNRPTTLRLDYPVEVDGETYPCSYVGLGDPGLPHAMVPLPGLRGRPEAELLALRRKLRAHPAFLKGASVSLFDVEEPGRIWERIFERDMEGFTYACNTGAGSMAVVLTLQGAVDGWVVAVQMTGDELMVDVEHHGPTVEHLFLTESTNMVARGEFTDGELPLWVIGRPLV